MHVCIIGKKYRNKTFMLIIGIVFQSIYMYICEYIKTNLCQLSASVAQKNEGHTYFLEVKVIKKTQYTYKIVNGSVWGCQGNGGPNYCYIILVRFFLINVINICLLLLPRSTKRTIVHLENILQRGFKNWT